MVSFPTAIKSGFQGYFDFGGRSTRAEYWWWILFIGSASIILSIIDYIAGLMLTPTTGIMSSLFGLAIWIPGIAISFRRLHDINRSAWWILLYCVPLIGTIMLLVWTCKQGDEGENKYGANATNIGQ